MIDERDIFDLLITSQNNLRPSAARLWDAINIHPEAWEFTDSGRSEKRFWVVAILGRSAVWYNHIEEGYVLTPFSKWEKLERYEDAAMPLEYVIEQLLRNIEGEQKYSP
ncbi:MAG: hypothetical protein AAGH41_12770 [Pseudomonadota bacterium]